MGNMKKIAYGAVGVILLFTTIFTGRTGLGEENIEIYKKALELQSKMEGTGFENFRLEDYTVAFYDGKNDYVIVNSDTEITTQKREPVMDTLVATAWETDGEYQVLCPTVEKLQGLVNMLMPAAQVQTTPEDTDSANTDNAYTQESHVATIWHEAFHCYQLTNYEQGIEKLIGAEDRETANVADTNLIVTEVDGNEQVVNLYKKEIALLEKAINEDDLDVVKEIILEYKQLDEERKEFLSSECQLAEAYYTVMEGTAYYVEKLAYANLQQPEKQDDRTNKNVVWDINQTSANDIKLEPYTKGTNKYYNIGRAQCLILDKLSPDWKADYDFSRELIELIYEEAGILQENKE